MKIFLMLFLFSFSAFSQDYGNPFPMDANDDAFSRSGRRIVPGAGHDHGGAWGHRDFEARRKEIARYKKRVKNYPQSSYVKAQIAEVEEKWNVTCDRETESVGDHLWKGLSYRVRCLGPKYGLKLKVWGEAIGNSVKKFRSQGRKVIWWYR